MSSGTTVKLSWKLKLLEYDNVKARSNRRSIRAIIADMFKGLTLPSDLKALLELLDCDYLVPGDYLCTHCSLMDDINKSHMIGDIHMEFTSNLTNRDKAIVAEPLYHYIKRWKDLIRPNTLLSGMFKHKFDVGKDDTEEVEGGTDPRLLMARGVAELI
ncbi:hypothetical protein SETIT_4G275000v2 [Setaria italica]|uniref:Uncharacterized protein n=1 Tax=Setaria italica TaxID=4555 RepID=A0A368QZ91_SETIT|nr:hypothetical protein SETIT_4G275000v2 [Setaria italica]